MKTTKALKNFCLLRQKVNSSLSPASLKISCYQHRLSCRLTFTLDLHRAAGGKSSSTQAGDSASRTHAELSSPGAGSGLPSRHSSTALSQEREGMSAIPMHGKLLWKLMLKEQDSSTVTLDSSCYIPSSPASGSHLWGKGSLHLPHTEWLVAQM